MMVTSSSNVSKPTLSTIFPFFVLQKIHTYMFIKEDVVTSDLCNDYTHRQAYLSKIGRTSAPQVRASSICYHPEPRIALHRG